MHQLNDQCGISEYTFNNRTDKQKLVKAIGKLKELLCKQVGKVCTMISARAMFGNEWVVPEAQVVKISMERLSEELAVLGGTFGRSGSGWESGC